MRKVLRWVPVETLVFGLALAGILFVPQQMIPLGVWAVLAGLAFLVMAGFRYYQSHSLNQLESGIVMSASLCLVAGVILLIDPSQFWLAIIAGMVVAMLAGLIYEMKKGREE